MLNNVRLSTLLALGFGILLSISITTSVLSFSALSDNTQSFKDYRLLARDTNLAGRLQANMLLVRLYVKEFFKTGSQTSVENYQSRLQKLNLFLDEAQQEIQKPERSKKISIISESIHDYVRNFDTVVELKDQRDLLVYDNLDPAGIEMRIKLSAIMKSAFNDRDPEASYYAARMQEHVLLARLYANKFLNTNAPKASQRAEQEIGIKLDPLIVILDKELENPQRRLLFSEFLTARTLYQKHLTAIQKLISTRNSIINKQLDVIGPVISNAAEDVKLSVKSDQDILGPLLVSQNERFLVFIGFFSLFSTLFSLVVAWYISKKIKHPIGGEPLEIMAITQQVARGYTDIDFKSKHELTGIFAALKEMVRSLNLRVQLAQEIAKGNLDTEVTLLSSEDSLGLALQKMLTELKERNNKLLQESKEKSEVMDNIEQQNWLKTQLEKINSAIQGVNNLQHLTEEVIQRLAVSVSAGHGVFYILTKPDNEKDDILLNLLGSYAFQQRKHVSNQVELGQGLVGQCALEKKVIVLTDVPNEYIQISSGLGQYKPLTVIALPVLYENDCLGVIELASFTPFSTIQQDLLGQIGTSLGVVINNVQARQRIETLLVDSNKQAVTLQEQQEELKASNENLIEQTQQLKVSEEELRQQSEELTVSNEELGKKQKDLQAQKDHIEASEKALSIQAKELTIASKYKSEFLANMSHELRTPLNSLLLLSKSLAENSSGHLDETEVEDANIIYDGGQSLLSLINDILDLSKVEAGKLNIHLENVPLQQIKSRLLQLFNPLANDKNIKLTADIALDLPEKITTDSQRLDQILRNLISNAIKFTPVGEVNINFTKPGEDILFRNNHLTAQNCIAISVTDSGIGINEDKIQAIFEAFQQEDGSTSRKYGGTGLGLTIARELSHLLGGEIQLESKVNSGSCFTLFIPINNEGAHELDEETKLIENDISTPKKEAPEAPSVKARHITNFATMQQEIDQQLNVFIDDDRFSISTADKSLLVIDDDKVFARILRDHARKNGYKCLVAGDGRSGIYLAQQHKPSGIILDLMLPDIDGHQVLEQLKASSKTRNIPVEIISAHSENKSEALTQGAIGLQTKPVSSEQLQQVLNEIENQSKVKTQKILIIEDDKNHSTATTRLLENRGLQANSVSTGEAGISEITTGQYDCVILDLGLPDMTGIELLQKINSTELEHLPAFIVYTGKELTDAEQSELDKYSSTVVIKGVDSPARLLDDISLFLHNIEENVQQNISEKDKLSMRLLHDEDDMLQGRKILLADDDMRNAYALSKKLLAIGCDVEIADNGKEALELLEKNSDFELILMDIMMPIMDGNEAMSKIRSMKEYQKVPIIALTAKTMPEDRELALKSGASEYLTKPIDFEKLISILRIWLFNPT
ncbi:response regulator [Psychromonas sp. Urea-02u-13]|uniref:response regulator n=1 Tax=Psychromonas sp. Urea-02u-13 TaxID=2058326 RepID=UPI000C3361E0|nr:response regulator [Psychromonas sp. Urea-02u-13]PKG38415.1 histidine kinase [Psychromonas sp. Urea-02u-13]